MAAAPGAQQRADRPLVAEEGLERLAAAIADRRLGAAALLDLAEEGLGAVDGAVEHHHQLLVAGVGNAADGLDAIGLDRLDDLAVGDPRDQGCRQQQEQQQDQRNMRLENVENAMPHGADPVPAGRGTAQTSLI